MVPSLLHEPAWYEQAFDARYLRVYAHRNDAEAESRIEAMISLLGIAADARVLDVGCGEGRYSRALTRRGMRVTGVDLSKELIQEGRERSQLLPGCPVFLRSDARQLPYYGQFDAAVSLFTSFGYFESSDDDLKIFKGVARALVPGGRFLIDYLNQSHVCSTLVEEDERETGLLRVATRRWIDEEGTDGPVVRKAVKGYDRATGLLLMDFEERVRLYTADELDALLTTAGFTLVGEPMGGVDGAPLDTLSTRLVRVVELPAT